tara:strand:+ start:4831 stop:5160 length:330 start_codon:yes stop_codon:yes gene_type:complete
MGDERRVLDFDPASGIKNNFIFEAGEKPSQDNFTIETTQDVTEIIKKNKLSLNEVDKRAAWGEWSKIASLPLTIYYDLKARGVLDDKRAFSKWLNDPDNKYFRTRGGRI